MSPWRLLRHQGVGAAEGLALDEALAAGYGRHSERRPPTLRLYTYRSHCALVGRYQHLEAEVDLDACRRTATPVNRRPTGGGAIVMGAGQLGVALATAAPAAQRPRQLLEGFAGGLIAGLARLGVTAGFRGKNDLEVDGRKIAGLGLALDGSGGLLLHASVLADLDVAFMLQVLRIPAAKLGGHAVASVEERITTVTGQTGQRWDGQRLAGVVAAGFAEALGVELALDRPTADEQRRAAALVTERYANPTWWHEHSPRPEATTDAELRLPVGLVRLYLALSGDTIKSLLFTGDFTTVPGPLVALEEALRWKRLERAVVEPAVAACLAGHPELGPPDAVAEAVLSAGTRRTATAAPQRHGSCYFPEVLTPS